MIDCSEMTWKQMSDTVFSIWKEINKRNPIGINLYSPTVLSAGMLLDEIANGEADNFTSECGPKEPKHRKKA